MGWFLFRGLFRGICDPGNNKTGPGNNKTGTIWTRFRVDLGPAPSFFLRVLTVQHHFAGIHGSAAQEAPARLHGQHRPVSAGPDRTGGLHEAVPSAGQAGHQRSS